MNTLYISSEAHPFSKVGGLSDVAGSLPIWLNKVDINSYLVIPFCREVELSRIKVNQFLSNLNIEFNGQKENYNVLQSFFPNTQIPVFLIDNVKYFRGTTVYTGDPSFDPIRYIFFSKVVSNLSKYLKFKVDLIHFNDYFGSLIPYYLDLNKDDTKTVLTIHNIASQGIINFSLLSNELDSSKLVSLENGTINLLKEGIIKADKINTVSKTYRDELLTTEYAFGNEDILVSKGTDFVGILNGVNYDEFDPSKDSLIPYTFSSRNIQSKRKDKRNLQKDLGLKNSNSPILSMVTRLVSQKGIDLLIEIFDELMKYDSQLVVLGRGESKYENFFKDMQIKYKGRVSANIVFDEVLEHRIYAGSDIYLMPSRFEPGGLSDLIAMKYGTIPVVRRTGGLADAIENIDIFNRKGNGFSFDSFNSRDFLNSILQSLNLYKNKSAWKYFSSKDMDLDYSWGKSALVYKDLYESLFIEKVEYSNLKRDKLFSYSSY